MSARVEPFFTIAVPTYNRAALLRDLLPRLLKQSFADFELIVSDDASTDETPELMRQFSDPRLRYVRRERNLRFARNLNTCLAEARGRYFVLNQDDDMLHGRFLERCHAAVRDRPDVVMYAAPVWRGGGRASHASMPLIAAPAAEQQYYVVDDLPIEIAGPVAAAKTLCRIPFAFPAIALRTDAMRRAGGFDVDCESYGTDVVVLVKVTVQGSCIYDPRFGAYYRLHESNTSRRQGKQERLRLHRLSRDRAVEAMREAGLPWADLVRAELETMGSGELLHIFKQLAESGVVPELQAAAFGALVRGWPRSRLRLAQKLVSRVGIANMARYLLSQYNPPP